MAFELAECEICGAAVVVRRTGAPWVPIGEVAWEETGAMERHLQWHRDPAGTPPTSEPHPQAD